MFQKFQAATTAEEKEKIKDKALKELPTDYAKKMLAVAKDNAKDPAAVDALLWVCTTQYVAQTPEAKGAFKVLLKDHADSDKLAGVCKALAQQSDADRIRQIREKATNSKVKAQAGYYLAEASRRTSRRPSRPRKPKSCLRNLSPPPRRRKTCRGTWSKKPKPC